MSDERTRVEVTEDFNRVSITYASESLNPNDAVDALSDLVRAYDEVDKELMDDE